MKTLLITFIITILPLFANAQVDYNMQIPLHDPITGAPMQRPNTPKLETVKPLSRNHIERAQAKLIKEEQKLVKLAEKRWEKEADLKAKQLKLQNLEKTAKSGNDSGYQKDIEKYKKEIAKSQDELNEIKTEVELMSKKVEEFEKAIEEAKLTRQG
ncbi:hypothetical protein IRZ83_08990 [Flavobacterium sp. JLP]|uniref:hypothetical protein n=1 Tax=unclassified Flavobacterium TaxID=196869 RepID=UPI0004930E6B|nr:MULTISPECIES: hypothetical protein [unclassified Flavobacterium]MBF4506805.1 hypothetical protein [Flavobacterium sp. JLP]